MPPYSGLETMLIALLSAFISCAGLFFALTRIFMTRKECNLNLRANNSTESQTCRKIDELINAQSLQFRMLRSIIVNMDIDKQEKEKILNMSGRQRE